MKGILYIALVCSLFVVSCASSVRFTTDDDGTFNRSGRTGGTDDAIPVEPGTILRGLASYYADSFDGHQTSNGEIYTRSGMSAAHRTLPFGTSVRVRNLMNNRSVIVRINDRGPLKTERMLDLSRAAAEELDMLKAGVVEVEVTVLR